MINIFMGLFRSKLKVTSRAFCRVAHWFLRHVSNSMGVGGRFGPVVCVGPDGEVKWIDDAKNGVTNAGLDDLLNTYFSHGSTKAAWYIGIIDNANYASLSAADTNTSGGHPTWIECTAYTNANRLAWGPGTSSGQSIVNAATCDFAMNATKSIRGLFLISENTIGGTTTGLLWSTALFSGGVKSVDSGDTLKVTYTISGISG